MEPTETQIIRTGHRFRSRHMIPMEMLTYTALGLSGFAGAFPMGGYLHTVLTGNDLAFIWGIVLLPLAIVGFFVSLAEWWLGHEWENGYLRRSLFARWWLSLLSVCAWLVVLYWMAQLKNPVNSMVMTACMIAPFHFWSFWVNLRVYTALDPKLKTEKLKRSLEHGKLRF